MAILVTKYPERRYQMIGAMGVSKTDIEQAENLNTYIEKRLTKLIADLEKKDLMPTEKGKGSLETYWELGKAIIDIVSHKYFSHKAEIPLLWRNIKMNLSDDRLLYRRRGPYREHLWYCFRLGGYPKLLSKKMNWGEWVTIFDSSGINQEPRFDSWFHTKLKNQKGRLERQFIRKFAPCVNELLKDIDVHSLNENELFNCYEAAWSVACIWEQKAKSDSDNELKREIIQQSIRNNFVLLDEVMESTLKAEDFAEKIIK